MRYSVRFDSETESAETAKILAALSSNYRLSLFVRLALEAYVASPEGKRVYSSLVGRVGKSKKGQGKKAAVVEVKPAAQRASIQLTPPALEQKNVPAVRAILPVQETTEKPSVTGPELEQVGNVIGRIFR